jgi:hypothetical protein
MAPERNHPPPGNPGGDMTAREEVLKLFEELRALIWDPVQFISAVDGHAIVGQPLGEALPLGSSSRVEVG